MSGPFILISDYTIRPDDKDAFLTGFREIADIARADEPRLLYFAEHISDDGTGGSTVQIHTDATNMERHMELVGERIQDLVQYLDFSSIRIYGTPTDAVLEQMRQLAGPRVTVKPLAAGFDRLVTS